jgi:hypothetical protein
LRKAPGAFSCPGANAPMLDGTPNSPIVLSTVVARFRRIRVQSSVVGLYTRC